MTVAYHSTRAGVAKWYWYSLRHNRLHQAVEAAWLSLLMYMGFSWSRTHGWGPVGCVAAGVAIAMVGAVLSAAYPQLRFKPQERTLTASPDGLSSSIGSRSRTMAWSKVGDVVEWDGVVRVTSRYGNAMLIPFEAFGSTKERQEFVSSCRTWLAAR